MHKMRGEEMSLAVLEENKNEKRRRRLSPRAKMTKKSTQKGENSYKLRAESGFHRAFSFTIAPAMAAICGATSNS